MLSQRHHAWELDCSEDKDRLGRNCRAGCAQRWKTKEGVRHIGSAHVLLGLMALVMGKYLELKAKISLKWCGVVWCVQEAHWRSERTVKLHVRTVEAQNP